ncbi:hypothetical protein B0H10DRAFT_1951956 [Mycena sp. CBHHK59/15]|nr:hypothetical protein B0H10DRAFT_1951956 [Mycena sp. CBHHK59/15]
MSFFLHALLLLALANFTPQASAYIVVVSHGGLSTTHKIIIIVVTLVILLLLIACRIARARQQRQATLIPVTVMQLPPQGYAPQAANYVSQGPGGYNGYTVGPPPQAQYPPPQMHGYGPAPPVYGNAVSSSLAKNPHETVVSQEKSEGGNVTPVTDINAQANYNPTYPAPGAHSLVPHQPLSPIPAAHTTVRSLPSSPNSYPLTDQLQQDAYPGGFRPQ